MPNSFLYGPYLWLSESELPPGAEHFWTIGPWHWYPSAVTITVHLAHWVGGHEAALEVTSMSARMTIDTGEALAFMDCTIRNVGRTAILGYSISIGGIAP